MIDQYTKLMGLLGYPLGHSRSPLINNYIAKLTGTNIAYMCFETNNSRLKDAADALKKLGARGFNVTIPYKSDIIRYIDKTDEDVDTVGACNTVKISEGTLLGYNTDIEGFYRALIHDTACDPKDKRITVIGAGGAARAIVYSMKKRSPYSITILNRTVSKAAALAKSSGAENYGGLVSGSVKWLENSDIIINTTSAGMHPATDQDPIGFYGPFKKDQIVYDIIYDPFRTKMLERAQKNGAEVSNGLSMLIFQAVMSFELINDVKIPEDVVKKVIRFVNEKVYGGESKK